MEYTPPISNKKPYFVCFFAFLLFSACYAVITVWGKFVWLFQIAAILFAVILIEVLIRYVMTRHTYVLDGENFIIIRKTGNKKTVACDVSLRMAMGVVEKKNAKNIEQNFGPIFKAYNYCQNLFPKTCYFYIFELSGKRCAVSFEPDEAFLSEMKARMAAKEV